MSFRFELLVSMTCQSCVQQISRSLEALKTIDNFDIQLASKRVTVVGKASPSQVIGKLEDLGRTVILRGLGDQSTAAVCILEQHDKLQANMQVYGLVRLVEISQQLLFCDITLSGLAAGLYRIEIRQTGDLRKGSLSTGNVWERGDIGTIQVDSSNRAQQVFELRNVRLWEVIGRAIVLESSASAVTILGVIARSAGLWENEKMVCTCSGQSVWDERQEMLRKTSLH